jgi:hypothetical protein
VELLDTAGNQNVMGNLAATTLMVGGASGPLFRNNAGTIEARNNANSALSSFNCANISLGSGQLDAGVIIGTNNTGFACHASLGVAIASTMRFGVTSGSNPQVTPDVTLSRASAGVWQMGTTANNALGSLNLANLNAVAATIANNATRASNLVSMSSAFNIGNGNSVLSIGYTGADMGRALSVSSASFTTGAMTIAQSTSANASNTNVSGLLVTGTFQHTDAGGATSIGNGGRFVATNTTASSGTLFGLDVLATTNAANVTGLRVTAATTSGTAIAIDAVGSIQSSSTITGGLASTPVTFAVLNATTATATLGLRRITDRSNRLAYPDGTNWRFVSDDAIIS